MKLRKIEIDFLGDNSKYVKVVRGDGTYFIRSHIVFEAEGFAALLLSETDAYDYKITAHSDFVISGHNLTKHRFPISEILESYLGKL